MNSLSKIFIMSLLMFIACSLIWKKEIFKSLFFTLFFIITLWINIPCFIGGMVIKNVDELTAWFMKCSNELGILYTIIANLILGVLLYLQGKWWNKTAYTYNSIKKIYDEFGENAIELYIVGKDLDFLYEKKFMKQTNRIIALGKKCKLLCEMTQTEKLLEKYNKVNQNGVEIKFYMKNDNITNLKGQIKVDQNGNKKAIFMSRENKKYKLMEIENQFLITSILERYNEIYKKSTVPQYTRI